MLQLVALHKHFGERHLIRGISLAVKEGQRIVISGRNGCGKTTLIDIVSGYSIPDKGLVIYNGKRISNRRPDQIARMGIARTFQHPRCFHGLSVMHHLMLAALSLSKYGLSQIAIPPLPDGPRHILDLVAEWITSEMGAGVLTKSANELSYGQIKLLNFFCVLVRKPALVLLDEPFSGLDRIHRSAMLDLLSNPEIVSPRMPIIIAEHVTVASTLTHASVVTIEAGQLQLH